MKPEQPDALVHLKGFLRRQLLLKAIEQRRQFGIVLVGGGNAARERQKNRERQRAQQPSPAGP